MKKKSFFKKSIVVGLSILLGTSIIACGGKTSGNSNKANSSTNSSSTIYRTLDQIKESGTINIGVFSDKNPFGYVDEYGKYQGYDVYFAERIGKDLGVKINYVSTEAANRVEYLETGKVDIILANFTVTEDRAKKVDNCEIASYWSTWFPSCFWRTLLMTSLRRCRRLQINPSRNL